MIIKKHHLIVISIAVTLILWCSFKIGLSVGSRSMIADRFVGTQINERPGKGSRARVEPLEGFKPTIINTEPGEPPVIDLGRIEARKDYRICPACGETTLLRVGAEFECRCGYSTDWYRLGENPHRNVKRCLEKVNGKQ